MDMRATLSGIEEALESESRSDFLVELAGIVERYLEDRQEELVGQSLELQELPSLLLQLSTAVDTSVTDEL